MEKQTDKKFRNSMKDINKYLDPENPAHTVVIAINNRNIEMYGPLQDCGLFKCFCRCEKSKDGGREESEAA